MCAPDERKMQKFSQQLQWNESYDIDLSSIENIRQFSSYFCDFCLIVQSGAHAIYLFWKNKLVLVLFKQLLRIGQFSSSRRIGEL